MCSTNVLWFESAADNERNKEIQQEIRRVDTRITKFTKQMPELRANVIKAQRDIKKIEGEIQLVNLEIIQASRSTSILKPYQKE